uniref:Uncharacterized protein n=1 Tax=Oryza brachyantha TaxID=4533 RepID=J3M600_ORYBR
MYKFNGLIQFKIYILQSYTGYTPRGRVLSADHLYAAPPRRRSAPTAPSAGNRPTPTAILLVVTAPSQPHSWPVPTPVPNPTLTAGCTPRRVCPAAGHTSLPIRHQSCPRRRRPRSSPPFAITANIVTLNSLLPKFHHGSPPLQYFFFSSSSPTAPRRRRALDSGGHGGVPQHAQDGEALQRRWERPPPLRSRLHAGVADHHGGRAHCSAKP